MKTDLEAYVSGLTAKDIPQNLTLDDVENFLRSLGVEQIERKNKYLIAPTICHNPIEDATSMKLYYYDNYKLFHCYTECGDSFNIIELYRRFMDVNANGVSYEDAVNYIKQFITSGGGIVQINKNFSNKYVDNDRYICYNNSVEQSDYNENVMDVFTKYYHPQWLAEGITKESMDKYNIRFSTLQNKVIIPHYDIEGRLIGIRGRAFNEDEIEEYGKYRPINFEGNQFNHHLSYNLYGLNNNKEAIAKLKRAILVESEKSVLLGDKFYDSNNIVVAVCGSNINKYQIALLTDLGVNDITVAFDKEYTNVRTPEARKYRSKIINLCKKYTNDSRFYYVFDEHNLLNKKDSPLDKGQEIWERLYKERIRVI